MQSKSQLFKVFSILMMFTISILTNSCSSFLPSSYNDLVKYMGVQIPEESDYPNSDGVVLFESNESSLALSSSGLYSRETKHVVIKLFKNIDKYANHSIYLSDGEKLEEIAARTIHPDGTIQQLNKNDFHIIMPDYARGASIHGDRVVKFTFPSVTKDCIIEYKYQKIVETAFSGDSWIIQNYHMPTLKSQYILEVPKSLASSYMVGGMGLNWNAKPYNYNFDAKPNYLLTAGGNTKTEWVITDIPGFEPERKMPHPSTCISRISFARSDLKGWKEVGEIYGSYLFSSLIISNQVKQKSDELTKGCETDLEKVEKIFDYVRKIRYFSVSLGYGGLIPNPPDQVMTRNYGDRKDKAILMIALLKAAGIDADLVLVRTKDSGEIDPGFPDGRFNHAICRVYPKGSRSFWIDPTDRFTKIYQLPWQIEDVHAFVLKPNAVPKMEKTPASKNSDNLMTTDIVLTITDDMKAQLDVKITFTGQQESSARYSFHDRREQQLFDAIKNIYGGKLKDIQPENITLTDTDDLNNPFELSFTYTISEIIQKLGDNYLLDISIFDILPSVSWLAEKERKFDIINDYPYDDLINFTIKYNSNKLKAKSLPTNFSMNDKDYNYQRLYFFGEGQQIIGKETFSCYSRSINKNRYPELKDFFSKVRNAANEKILFEVINL